MTVNISKPAVNLREELADLRKPTGIAGEAMMRAETPQEQFNLIGAGRRNLVINGAMQVAQRGTSTSITQQQAEFVTDRFQTYENSAGSLDVEQSTTAPDGFYNSTKWEVTSADTNLGSGEQTWVRQRVEGYNMAHLGWGTSAAQTVTLSFWVRSSVTGTFAGSFQNASGNRVYPYTYSILSADTWEHKKITVAGATTGTWGKDNSNGCTIYWSFGMATAYQGTAGAWASGSYRTASGETQLIATNGATFYLTGVQLELGKVATPFEHRSYGEELAACQRYLYAINGGGHPSSTSAAYGRFISFAQGNNATIWFPSYPVQMRALPSLIATNVSSSTFRMFNYNAQAAAFLSAISLAEGTTTSGQVVFSSASGISSGDTVSVRWFGNANASFQFDAEL